jgi:16S rRNA U1498 N3-methylase RsmE
MSEEYTLMQYENERLKQDLLYWRKVATESLEKSNNAILPKMKEMDTLGRRIEELTAENEEYHRTNERIWATTKQWILEDSAIISKQAGQIKYLTAKLKSLDAMSTALSNDNEKKEEGSK